MPSDKKKMNQGEKKVYLICRSLPNLYRKYKGVTKMDNKNIQLKFDSK